MTRSILTIAAATAMLTLAACGSHPGDRALSGAAIGAGSGAVIGAIAGGSPGTGAAVGALAGAAIGGLTTSSDFDLGTPIWH